MSNVFLTHFQELRRRLLWVFVMFLVLAGVAYHYSEFLLGVLSHPLAQALQGHTTHRLIYTGMAEAFVTHMKVALFMSSLASLPLLLNQIWLFVAPGLYGHEKHAAQPFLWATPLLFFGGAAFAYFVIIPPAWRFFLQFETAALPGGLPVQLEARLSEYLALMMQILLAFGLAFQIPVVLVFLGRLGVLKSHQLKAARRYAFLGILILSALLTPPDVLSMLGLALPLYGLYEMSLWIMGMSEKKQGKTNA